jgi:cysteinyl-tRNA synthetase
VFSLFDTSLGAVTEIRPARAGLVRMFACAPPVDRHAHLGELRAFLLADLIRRNGERQGISVILCQAVCDVGGVAGDGGADPGHEDPLPARTSSEGKPPQEVARPYEDTFRADCAALNIAPPDYAPRAGESAGQVVELISKLIEAGHAYSTDSGFAYFDAGSFPDYKVLPDAASSAASATNDGEGRRSAADWPLWIAAPSGSELSFEAPWGTGRPTCDAACSALSLGCLGSAIDVHTGVVGLRLSHHEKERAQSDSLVGHEVVRHWALCEPALFDGDVITLGDVAARDLDPLAARLTFLEHRYRERMALSWQALAAADGALRRWRELVADWATEPSKPMCAEYWARIRRAFDDDLDTPDALRVLQELAADHQIPAGSKFETFAAADRVLGLDLVSLVGQPRPDS